MLKAFVITKDPWWEAGLRAQSYAWAMPTRELHFYPEERGSAGSGKQAGMIMLYTDQPGIHYWDLLIPDDERDSVLWRTIDDLVHGVQWDPSEEVRDNPFGLLDLLVRRLLVVPHPGLAYTVNEGFPIKVKKLEGELRNAGRPTEAEVVAGLLTKLEPETGHILGISQRIVECWPGLERGTQEAIQKVLRMVAVPLPQDWLHCLDEALQVRRNGIDADRSKTKAGDVLAYGIRDWSAKPFGGAAHLWRPGHSYLPVDENGNVVTDTLLAFGLRERAGGPENVHICGEAFSGNQGFIEGALQTTERVVAKIIGKVRFDVVIGRLNLKRPKEQRFVQERAARINDVFLESRYRKLSITPTAQGGPAT